MRREQVSIVTNQGREVTVKQNVLTYQGVIPPERCQSVSTSGWVPRTIFNCSEPGGSTPGSPGLSRRLYDPEDPLPGAPTAPSGPRPVNLYCDSASMCYNELRGDGSCDYVCNVPECGKRDIDLGCSSSHVLTLTNPDAVQKDTTTVTARRQRACATTCASPTATMP